MLEVSGACGAKLGPRGTKPELSLIPRYRTSNHSSCTLLFVIHTTILVAQSCGLGGIPGVTQ